jgi:hypothetical protein
MDERRVHRQPVGTGKEKWCASCHDKSPSVDYAPNVVGSEQITRRNRLGYYKTARPPADQAYASRRFFRATRQRIDEDDGCDACHDFTARHIDNVYPPTARRGSRRAHASYRLKRVNGLSRWWSHAAGILQRLPALLPMPRVGSHAEFTDDRTNIHPSRDYVT